MTGTSGGGLRGTRGKSQEALTGCAVELVLRAFEHHKDHARFQETQRSWFMLAYLGVSGVVWTAVLGRLVQAEATEPQRFWATMALAFVALLGLLTGLAVTKSGVEFQRHFKRGEAMIARMRIAVENDPALSDLLTLAMLGTAGDQNKGFSRFVSKSLGVAALHNYLIGALIAGAIGAIGMLWGMSLIRSGLVFAFSWVAAVAVFQMYRRLIRSPKQDDPAGTMRVSSSALPTGRRSYAPPSRNR